MVFTMTKDAEETKDMVKVIDKNERSISETGGRSYMEAFADWTLTQIPIGAALIDYEEGRYKVTQHDWSKEKTQLSPETAVAISEACKRGDVPEVQRLIGGSKLGGTPKEVKVDLGFKCKGLKAVQTFMKALPADLQVLMVDLKGNMLQLPGIKAVAAGLPKNLRSLHVDLTGNKIHNAGVEIFMKGIPDSVTSLTLGFHNMPIGPDGAKVIADNFPPALISLDMDFWGCHLTDDGTCYIAKKLPKTIEKFKVNIFGPNDLARRGHYIFQRLTENEGSDFHLPNLKPDNCIVNSKWFPQVVPYETSYSADSPCVADIVQLWEPCQRQECPEPPDYVEHRDGPVPTGTWVSPNPNSSFKSYPPDKGPR